MPTTCRWSNSGSRTISKPGEWVLAIGSPFGFDYSVTAGIISAIGRSLPTENNENYVPFIQTDVAINPGNSGGPLFNLDGEVVGINSQIYTRSGGFMGVSFAIPVDVALDVVDQLKAHGKVSRGWLGVVIQEVNRDLAESFGLDKPSGALVARVIEGGPAAKAGSARRRHHPASSTANTSICRADLPHFVGHARPGSEAQIVDRAQRQTRDTQRRRWRTARSRTTVRWRALRPMARRCRRESASSSKRWRIRFNNAPASITACVSSKRAVRPRKPGSAKATSSRA